jgi:hypothetical protein
VIGALQRRTPASQVQHEIASNACAPRRIVATAARCHIWEQSDEGGGIAVKMCRMVDLIGGSAF